jgi:RsiW-degrading membrane proteinase PrsW (M82 family)
MLGSILLSLMPVLLFLLALIVLDSYRLIPFHYLAKSIGAGGGVALACLFFNGFLHASGAVDGEVLRRFVAPLIEETVKAAGIVFLIRTRRVGFLVDTAIHGFAIGAGFALVENMYYVYVLDGGNAATWAVRGFGTAIMHGSTTSVLGMVSKGVFDRNRVTGFPWFVPGFLIAAMIHVGFNQLVLPPVLKTVILLATLPILVLTVFERSERATKKWLGTGFDTDIALLEHFHGGTIADTRAGAYLDSLRKSFSGEVVADMLCYLEIHLELSARAKGILLARKNGVRLPIGDDVLSRLEEARYLEKSVGRTGKLALEPILNMDSRELWQLYMLERETNASHDSA